MLIASVQSIYNLIGWEEYNIGRIVLSRTWTRARYENRIHWRIKDVPWKNIEFTMWPKVSIYPAGLCYTILKKLSDLAT